MDFHFHGLLPLLVVGGVFAFTGSVLYGTWLLGRYRGRDEQQRLMQAEVDARLRRLEETVAESTDALDRLEAAHRLTARLLTSEGGGRRAAGGGGG